MDRRSRLAAFATVTFLAIGALSQLASAAPKDAAAKKQDQDAMNNDYVMNADIPKAEASLKAAVNTCGASGCSPKVKAAILVHLGVVQVNSSKAAEAEKSFIEALKLDATITVEQDYMSPDVGKAFASAKAKAGGDAGTPGSAGTGESPGGTEPSGDELGHEVVPEQLVNTPVPLFVTVPEGMTIGKLVVRYKPFGGTWKKLDLTKVGSGWGASIPCAEVTTTGDLKYYINALDAAGEQIAGLGSLAKPFVTKIKNQLDGEPPHLPDEAPPPQCAAKEDCPPGFPGCAGAAPARGDKGLGTACENTEECQAGLSCKAGQCAEGEDDTGGGGTKPSIPVKRNWVGLFGSPDLSFVSGSNVCSKESQATGGFSCFISSNEFGYAGRQYHGNPSTGTITGGLALATWRVMASFDRLIGQNIMVGARAGWAFPGGPQPDGGNSFLPMHLELRPSYWFGKNPFARVGIRPFAFGAIGIAQVDTRVNVPVVETDTCPADGCLVNDNSGQLIQSNPQTQTVAAWRKSGQSFGAVGGGVMYAIKPNLGIVGAVKVSMMFPTTGLVISPEIGCAYGF